MHVICESRAAEEERQHSSKQVEFSGALKRWSTPVHHQHWRNPQ